jgi:hypothetical protein
MESIIALVAGASLAFVGSTYGAVLLKRFEMRQEARLRIFEGLLEPFRQTLNARSHQDEALVLQAWWTRLSELRSAFQPLFRAAIVAGKQEARFVFELGNVLREWQAELEIRSDEPASSAPFGPPPGQRRPRRPEEEREDREINIAVSLDHKVQELQDHLARKLAAPGSLADVIEWDR